MSPYTLHIQNGDPSGSNRVSSATVKLNGVDILTPTDLNQNVAGLDRTVTLAANNQLDVRVASDPGSYLIININGVALVTDTAPPSVAITAPADNSTTTATQITVSGTASDAGPGATGVAHVYVNDSEAAYNSATSTWTISNVPLVVGANQINALAVDQAGNQRSTSITVTRQSPANQAPTAGAGTDQTITFPQTASLKGTATDDGLPTGSSLTTTWSKVSGPGAVTFANASALVTTASFSAPGIYVLQLTASDTQLTASDTLQITVQPGAQPLVADFAISSDSGVMPLQVLAASSFTDDGPPVRLLDQNIFTYWATNTGQVTNQFVKFRLVGDQPRLVDRVRLQQRASGPDVTRLKDFEIQVSYATDVDADFRTVLSGTLQSTSQLQEFVFPNGMERARYVKLVAKNNYGSTSSLDLGTFQLIAAGGADSIISLPGQSNAAHDEDPALIANGAVVVDYSFPSNNNGSPNDMLDYSYSPWSTPASANQYATIQLAGAQSYMLEGVHLATWYDFGYGRNTAVKDFEVWVSNTTADDSAFTKVLTATAELSDRVQTFLFPGGAVSARYVKYVPIDNYGEGGSIDTLSFGVLAENVGRIVATSHPSASNVPAEAMLDNDPQTGWLSPSNVTTDLWVKVALTGNRARKLYGVSVLPNNGAFFSNGPRDFEIRVSTTTTDDAAFTTVYSGTLSTGVGKQTILFNDIVEARYVEFYWKNGYGASYIGVNGLEALAAPDDGSALIAYSSQQGTETSARSTLDVDSIRNPWITGFNQVTEQFLKVMLPGNELHTISHVALRADSTPQGSVPPKDFELQVSTSGWQDADYTTVLSGTLQNSDELQHFSFTPTQARSVRLLLHNSYEGNSMELQSFYVYSGDAGGATARFLNLSTGDGRTLSYSWNFGDGATSTRRDPMHIYTAPGLYTVKLTVTDDTGLSAQHQAQYQVLAAPLGADFTVTPLVTHEGNEYLQLFDRSSPQLGATAARYINFGDGSDTYVFYGQTSHNYPNSGTYQVTLTVGDDRGVKYTITKPVMVANLPPTVNISAGRTLVWGETFTSAPNISDASPDDRLTLQGTWNFGDGQTASCVNCTNASAALTHAYSQPGVYNATLTITDKDGGVGSATATYNVNKRSTILLFRNPPAQSDGSPLIIHAQLLDDFAHQPLSGRPVQLALNGATFDAVTGPDGVAEVSVPLPARTKIDIINGSFSGDSLYLNCGGVAVPLTAGGTQPVGAPSNAGTDFWLMFPPNYFSDGLPQQKLFITSAVDTNGTVTIPGLSFTQGFTVQANMVVTVQLPFSQVYESDVVQNLGIHVTSAQPVVVYGMNQRAFTSDAFLGLPVSALGTDYYILTYSNMGFAPSSGLGVVAAEDVTTVTITPAAAAGNHQAGVPYNVTLNQGQTYLLQNTTPTTAGDLSGSRVSSNKPIAVYGGHVAATIPAEATCCADHLVEQLPPVAAWGKRFATIPLATRTKGDFFRLIASQDNTTVYLNGNQIATLNSGQWIERILKDPAEIIATRPIMVAQFATSIFYDPPTSGKADPFMMVVPPYSQFLNHYTITTPPTGFDINYANIVAPTASLGNITIDGNPIPASSFAPIGVSGFSGAQVPLNVGAHTLDGPANFGLFVYGFAQDEGYGYPGGMNIAAAEESVGVTIAPETSSHSINTQGCVVAVVKDQDNNPLGGRAINFTVTGTPPSSSSATTDAAGEATLCYVATSAGTDQVAASVGTSQGTATIIWTPPNQAPVVDAGADQTITLPAVANLQGTASDDGLPTKTLNVSWSKVSGPGSVSFGEMNAAATTASFDAPGVYVLRLTAGDGELSASDDLQITVNHAAINQPPTVDAGADQSVAINGNLVINGGNDEQLVNGEIPGWTEVQGTNWTQATISSSSGFPQAQRGNAYFFASDAQQAELRQDIDVSAFTAKIAAGAQQFELKAYLRSAAEAVPDSARVIVEYRDATNTSVIATLDSGEITSTDAWHLTEDTRIAPAGTVWIRVRLIAKRNSGTTNDAFFDSITLRPLGSAAVKLQGTVADDGLPTGGSVSASWTTVSGPGGVTFTDGRAASAAASFTAPGVYVLRLTATDGALSASDDVTINVGPANQLPVVNAGVNQTITLPAAANLYGTVSDDGQPQGSSVYVSWSQVSGPGSVTFADENAAVTTASFSTPGVYILRLTADDGEYAASSDLTVTVNPAATNQAPTVNAGADQTISLPTDTVNLNGAASDDGLPAGSALSVQWTKVSGPGTVTFGDVNSATTTAQFNATGTYVLRLTASYGALSASSDVQVTLIAANQAPSVSAGADQTVLLSQSAQLQGSASDDGLPVGSTLMTTWTKVSGPGAVTFDDDHAAATSAQFSLTGVYVLRLTATDGALSTSSDMRVTVNDNAPPPTVQITAPTDGDSVTQPTAVSGSVSNGAWTLEYSLDSDDNASNRTWTTFASGNGAVSGALGTLDPTMMLNGLFDIRLTATDGYGQATRTTVSVVVERNLKVGNFTVSFTDLNIPVAGVAVEVARTYDSRDKRTGDFGVGWALGLKNIRVEKSGVLGLKWYETVSQEVFPNYCLEATGSHPVTVTFPGGRVFKFQAAVTPHCQRNAPLTTANLSFTPMQGTTGKLEVLGSMDVQVEGSIPGPVNLLSLSGVDIFNSSVFKFTAEDGTSYVIDQRAGLQSLTDANGNTLTVGAGGILHSSGKSITFNRDSLGRITSITDPNGNSQSYTYDSNGDLISYTDAENNTSIYTYDLTHRLLTIQDPRGIQPLRNDYDSDGRLVSHTDGFGKQITYIHDLASRIETLTDRLGNQTRFEYDERGNVLRKTDARGNVTSYTYDERDNVLTETNALGKMTTYTYDDLDHRTSITDPLGNVTQFTYNALGKVLTTTDPLGHVTTNTYNSAGNLLTTSDALNNRTTYTYSIFDGQRTSMTDALNHTTGYGYTNGYLTTETDAAGNETDYAYDGNGNRTSQSAKHTNALGQLETITTSYEYDHLNRLKKTTYADGSTTQVEYNSIGQQSATVDQLGYRTTYDYDEMGRLVKTTYPDGTHEETAFDAEGRRLTSTDRAGRVTSYTYDELGRLTKTTYPDGTFTQTGYDAAGQVLTTTDARGNTTRYFYDDAGRRTKVRNALNQETTFSYDAGGNQLSMTDALNHTTSYEYDADNRRNSTIYVDKTFESVGYDALGRSVFRTDQAGKTTKFTYDELGRLVKVTDALNQITQYSYDELGHQISQTDANNHTTRFEYDQLGRRVKRILPGGQFETYSYDTAGSLQSRTDFNGKTTTYTYDSMRRLLSKTPDASLNQPTVSYTYNLLGQRQTMTDATGVTTHSYDARNRLTSKQTPFGTLSYSYDQTGNLVTTRSSNPNGVSADYSYDALNRLSKVKDNYLIALDGGVTSYSYDTVGNLQSYQYPNGVTTSYGYNSLNRLTTMTVNNPVSALASYSYTLAAAGNRMAVAELSGRTVNYTYDDLYRLTSETITKDAQGVNGNISYSYDAVGNRLSRISTIAPVQSQSSSYDANDRLTSDSYDNNGNTINSSGSSYAYDFENHLTSLNGGTVRYVYDGDGNRVAKIVNGVTTTYLIDSNNPTGYAQVVDELQGGVVVRSYSYGHERINQRIVNGSLSFYQYDGHGSVRQLTNASGAVTDTYTYDAFGNLIYNPGTTPNDYLYSGEQFDANLGFYYLRARYLNPLSGRFQTLDTDEGKTSDPQSLHKYLYVRDNPTNVIDPSGHIGIGDVVGEINALTWRAYLFVGQYRGAITVGSFILKALDVALTFGDQGYRDLSLSVGHNPFVTLASLAEDAMLAFRYSRVGAEAPYIIEQSGSVAASELTIANSGATFPEKELVNFTRWSADPVVVEEGEVLYRVHNPGKAGGPWWTRVKPQSEIQYRIDVALRPEFTSAEQLSTIVVPKGYGLQAWEGSASYQGGFYIGGGNQLFIPNVPLEWVTTVPFK